MIDKALKIAPGAATILISGQADSAVVWRAKDAGVSAVLAKPFSPQDLKKHINSFVKLTNRAFG